MIKGLRGADTYLDGTPARGRAVAIAAAGPLIEIGVAATLLSLSPYSVTGIVTSPTGCAGLALMANGVVGLLIPVSRNSDAGKIFQGLGQILGAGRAKSSSG